MRGPPKDVDTTKLYETLGVSVFVRGLGLVAGKKNAGPPHGILYVKETSNAQPAIDPELQRIG